MTAAAPPVTARIVYEVRREPAPDRDSHFVIVRETRITQGVVLDSKVVATINGKDEAVALASYLKQGGVIAVGQEFGS